MKYVILLLASLLLFSPLITIGVRKLTGMKAKCALMTNIGAFCCLFALTTIFGFAGSASAAETVADAAASASGIALGLKYIGAGLAVGPVRASAAASPSLPPPPPLWARSPKMRRPSVSP